MSSIRIGIFATVTGAFACLGALACGDDASSGGAGGATTTSTTKTGTTATGNTTGTGNGTSNTGVSGTTTGGPVSGFCALECTAVADCCQGNPMCPGDAYPNNPTCDNGFCNGAQCANDTECTFGGVLPDNKCLTIDAGGNDFKVCLEPCTVDGDCTSPLTCVGEASDGTKYCSSNTAAGCMTDADCNGYGKCDTATHVCSCTGDTDCTAAGTACRM